MALSDFLNGINDSINDLIADASPGYRKWLNEDRQRAQLAAAMGQPVQAGGYDHDLAGVFAGLSDIPGFDGAMTVLDAPRRGIDSLLISAQHADAVDRKRGGAGTDWSEFFNTSTWSRAWDMASFDNAERPTGGALLANSWGFGGDSNFARLDPFDQAEAKKLQDSANATWYGRTLTTTLDLGESFISLPGTGVLARARGAAGISSLADAERVAQQFNDVGVVGRTTAQKAKDTALNLFVPNGAMNVDSLVERQVKGLREFDGSLDEMQTFNKLKARLETAPDGDLANLANVFTEINKVADPIARERLRTNTFLSALGSPTAKRAMIEEAPLLAKNFENLTTAPRETKAMTDLFAMRLDGEDLPLNEIVDRTWNTAADKAELAALKGEVTKRRNALADHQRLVDELGNLRRAGGVKVAGGARLRNREAQLVNQIDEAQATLDGHAAVVAGKEAEIAAVRPYLNRANSRINEILDIAGSDSTMALTGDAKPTMLNRMKTDLNEWMGADHYVFAGDGNTIVRLRSLPNRAARMIGAPQARGSIAVNEIGLGARQLGDTMARSGVFAPDEVRQMQNAIIRQQPMDRVGLVSHVQDTMLQRMATRFFRDRVPGISETEALQRAKEVTGLTTRSWGKGNDWVAKSADEQIKDDLVMVRDAEGQAVAFDGPSLRSQLADFTPIFDPWDFERTLANHEKTLVGNVKAGMSAVANLHEMAVGVWKIGALMRPGLMVRSMLDTGPRALASMSALETLGATYNGVANLMHNRALKGLAKVPFSGTTLEDAAIQARYMGLKPVKVGGRYEMQAAKDAADLQAMLAATSKGQTVHGALFHEMAQKYDQLKLDRTSWKRRQADSSLWHVGYKEYADMLLASPTARKLAEMSTKLDDTRSVAQIREEIKGSPEFTAEYRKYAQPMGRTRSEFLQQLVHEVDLMFPNDRVLKAAQGSGLSKKFLEREFPVGQRFDVPSPEMSALEAGDKMRFVKAGVDKAFRTLLDKPDMWLARNPTVVQLYNRNVKAEYAALAKQGVTDLTPEQLRLIDSRARNAAVGYVRNTFFDTTRFTGAHRALARVSPFIAAWEDAMMSWGRLIYDDPRRLTKLSAAYHSPYTVATSQRMNLVVDQDGNPITQGDNPDGVFIQVPLGAIGKKLGVSDYRIRLDSINSIAQGDTWWLPGVGPTVSMAATYALGSGNIISREAALDLVDTKNPLGKALLKSVFLGGEVPPADAASLAQSTLPGWVRTLVTETTTTGKIRTRQTAFNNLVAEALANGQTLRDSDYSRMWDQADRQANAAAVVRLIASAGFGMTGSAQVDGQFYADQLHIISAMSEEQRGGLSAEEFFAKKYPEAADLEWSITKNETGIVASVNAAKAESRLSGLLRQPQNKDVGWMVLGKDNMVDTEFSRTAYSMQRADGTRQFKSSDEAMLDAQAAVGDRQVRAWGQQVLDQMIAGGADPAAAQTSDLYRNAMKTIRAYVSQTNPAYSKSESEFVNRQAYYLNQARRLSSSGPLKDRSDMAMFRDYDAARAEVMQSFGIGSFSGTSEQYVKAKAVMWQVGQTLASRDLGFMQLWDKFLAREVE